MLISARSSSLLCRSAQILWITEATAQALRASEVPRPCAGLCTRRNLSPAGKPWAAWARTWATVLLAPGAHSCTESWPAAQQARGQEKTAISWVIKHIENLLAQEIHLRWFYPLEFGEFQVATNSCNKVWYLKMVIYTRRTMRETVLRHHNRHHFHTEVGKLQPRSLGYFNWLNNYKEKRRSYLYSHLLTSVIM